MTSRATDATPATADPVSALQGGQRDGAAAAWRYRLFVRMWAGASLFHLAGNAREALTTSSVLAVSSVLLAAAAALSLLRPERHWWPLVLCGLVPVTAFYEAPVVGNHWVLASAISVALLLAAVVTPRGGRHDGAAVWARFAPAARLTLLLAYGFAAFAKLNSDFLDPAVSCAVYYHNQLVGSWGLDALSVTVGAPAGRGLAVGAALTEVAVVVGLAVPRTRRAALVLATSFHWLLAMDLGQHFWDFSAVLFAAFLLFLDDDQVTRLRVWTDGRSRVLVRPSLVRVLVIASAGIVSALAVAPVPTALDVLLILLGHVAWWAYGTSVVLAVLLLLRTPGGSGRPASPMRPPSPVLLAVPVLVLLNGLTPYLEVKTGFGWNMYSNLRTVAGETNHLLVPSTFDLTGLQRDQVRILQSSDQALQQLVGQQYALVYSEFREYAHKHPDAAVTYERGGRVVEVARLADDPASRGEISAVSARLQSFRVIDVSGEERCQPSFSPAR